MKEVSQTKQFLRDVKRASKRGKDISKLKKVVRCLANDSVLPDKHRDHALTGQWKPFRDCHIEPDWILVYFADDDRLVLQRTGSHSDLFK